MAEVKGGRVMLQNVLENQGRILNTLESSGIIREGLGAHALSFEEKNGLELPFKSVDDFKAFDLLLREDENCLKDFVSKHHNLLMINLFTIRINN